MCNSLHLLIPNSQSEPTPPHLLPLGNHKSLLYVCESVSFQYSFIIRRKKDATLGKRNVWNRNMVVKEEEVAEGAFLLL